MSAATTCKSRLSGKKKETESKKEGPYRQANSGTGQEGTIQNIGEFPDNVK
jgi:hypothetical protein